MSPTAWRILFLACGAAALAGGPAGASAPDRELRIADRYFARRQARPVEGLLGRSAARSETEILSSLVPAGYSPGQSWGVALDATRPPLDTPVVREVRIARLRYTVVDWGGVAEPRLLLRIEAPDFAVRGVHLEHRLDFRARKSEFRRCRSDGACGPWILTSTETLRLGGEDAGFGWEHGPVLLPIEGFAAATVTGGEARWESEDFFGRRIAWRWRTGEPWPRVIENAQGRATLAFEEEP